jgi:lysophospholipase L1-like esterase
LKRFTSILTENSNGIQRNIPNKRYWRWEINELNFRGRAIELEKKKSQIRIVCLGASETFGYYESKGKEWPSQLGKILKDKFPRVEVINVSGKGLYPTHKKEFVKKYILPLQPDILILYHHRFIRFLRDQMRGITGEKRAKKANKKTTRNPVEFLSAHMRYFFENEQGEKRYLPKWLSERNALRKLLRKIKKREKKFLVEKEPLDEVPEHLVVAYERNLRVFIDYLKENNIILVLSTHPFLTTESNKDKYHYELLHTRQSCVELSEQGMINALTKHNEMLRRIAQEHHFFCIDNDHLIPKTKEYFIDNFHYTDKGAEVIAKNIHYFFDHCGLLK